MKNLVIGIYKVKIKLLFFTFFLLISAIKPRAYASFDQLYISAGIKYPIEVTKRTKKYDFNYPHLSVGKYINEKISLSLIINYHTKLYSIEEIVTKEFKNNAQQAEVIIPIDKRRFEEFRTHAPAGKWSNIGNRSSTHAEFNTQDICSAVTANCKPTKFSTEYSSQKNIKIKYLTSLLNLKYHFNQKFISPWLGVAVGFEKASGKIKELNPKSRSLNLSYILSTGVDWNITKNIALYTGISYEGKDKFINSNIYNLQCGLQFKLAD